MPQLCAPLSQAGPELPPSLSSGCQATEELPAGTRGWHQGLHQAQHFHPAQPEGGLCPRRGGERAACAGKGSSGVSSKPLIVFLCPFSAGRLCCKYDTLSVGLDTLTALSPHANVRQPSGHISGEVTGSLCRCVLLGLGTAGSFWPLSQAALCSLSTILPAAGTGGHLQQGYAVLF